MSKFKVGAGIAPLDIPESEYPAMSQFAVCESKYDSCFCRAIAIETEDKQLMLMAYELSDIPEVPELEKKIAEAVGYDEGDIVITVTHNHTSPCDRGSRSATDEEREAFRNKFLKIELEASLTAAKAAKASVRPARMGYGEIESFINRNEITRNPSIGYLCDTETNGYSDKTLAIIKFVDDKGKLICVLMNHCTHATLAMGPGLDGKYATSGNFTGITSRFVEDYYGGGCIAAWTSGAAGNQHPVFGYLSKPYTDGYVSHIELPNGAEHMLMEHTGRQHAIDAINCIDNINDYSDEMDIKHVKTSITLPNQKNNEHHLFHKRVDYGMGVRSNMPEPAPAFVRPEMVPDPEHPSELLMELVMLGDTAIVGLGCELFCQIGRDIKNAVPAKHTVVITHTPGYVGDNPHAVGYIVDKSSVGSTNMKVFRNLIPGGYDDMIVDAAVRMYNDANG